MKKQVITLLSTGLLLTSCAAHYGQSNFFKGGYNTTQISDCDFCVGYENGLFNNATNPAKQDHFVMRQAAELTLNHGYTHFTIAPSVGASRVRCYRASEAPTDAYNAEEVLSFQQCQQIPS